MSIDGIGGPPRGGVGPAAGSTPAGAPFEVKPPEGAAGAEAPATSLARLESGELSFDQYLDARVEEAVAPLADKLSPTDLEFVKSSLRVELETDPVLVELVRRAAGGAPTSADR